MSEPSQGDLREVRRPIVPLISATSPTELISLVCDVLRVPDTALWLALSYYHRYGRARQADGAGTPVAPDDTTMALACMTLACKVSEHPRRLREIIVASYSIINADLPRLHVPSALYDELRSSVSIAELVLARYLQFQLRFSLPDAYLPAMVARALQAHGDETINGRYDVRHTRLYRASAAWVSRALLLPRLATLYDPATLACACLHAASRSSLRGPYAPKAGGGTAPSPRLGRWIAAVAGERERHTVDEADLSDALHDLDALSTMAY